MESLMVHTLALISLNHLPYFVRGHPLVTSANTHVSLFYLCKSNREFSLESYKSKGQQNCDILTRHKQLGSIWGLQIPPDVN